MSSSANHDLNDFISSTNADGKMSDTEQKAAPLFEFKSNSTLSKFSNLGQYTAQKLPNVAGEKKRMFEAVENLKENKTLDDKDAYNSPKHMKLNDFATVKSKKSVTLSLDSVMKDSGNEVKLLFAKWSNAMSEHESFEKIIPARLDKILKDALAYEENLIKQKKKLEENLHVLTRIWKKD